MNLLASRPPPACVRSLLVTLVLVLGMAASPEDRSASVSASCGQGCLPAPAEFQVPPGTTARAFVIRALSAGKACSGQPQQPLKGFSIRKRQQTVFVYYMGPYGSVSDPVPLRDLELPPGTYHLYAVPAAGATVTLVFRIGRGG